MRLTPQVDRQAPEQAMGNTAVTAICWTGFIHKNEEIGTFSTPQGGETCHHRGMAA